MQRLGVLSGLGARAHVGLGDDLQQRRAGAVQVDAGLAVVVLMQALARVFFQMGAGQVDLVLHVADEELDRAALHHRDLELADLVTLGQVRIEIVLAREDGQRRHLGADRQAETDGALDGRAVQHRQRAGKRQVHRRGLGIGRCAKGGRAAAEDLALRRELDVVFEADNDLITADELGCGGHVRFLRARPGASRSPAGGHARRAAAALP